MNNRVKAEIALILLIVGLAIMAGFVPGLGVPHNAPIGPTHCPDYNLGVLP